MQLNQGKLIKAYPIMLSKAAVWSAAACLILIAHATSAWEPTQCKGSEGELISLDLKNCPDKSGDYCRIQFNQSVSYKLKFKSGELGGVKSLDLR